MAWDSRTFGGLPEAGGLMDQPAGLLRRMRAALSVYEAWMRWKAMPAGEAGQFAERYPGDWTLVQRVMEMSNGEHH